MFSSVNDRPFYLTPFSTLTALEMIDSHEESAGGESYFFPEESLC